MILKKNVWEPTIRQVMTFALRVRSRKSLPRPIPVRALSLACAAHRWGFLDEVKRVCGLFPGPEADLLLGLLAIESGQKSDFGQAGPEADYLRALGAIAAGETSKAVSLIDSYLAFAPKAYRPQLVKAYLTKDVKLAQSLAQQNLGSPEAQLVLSLLGDKQAAGELKQLLDGNVDAAGHITAFQQELEQGLFKVVSRYQPKP